MTAVAVIVMLTLICWGFYLIRSPEQINWRRPAKAPHCTVCGCRHWPVEDAICAERTRRRGDGMLM